MRYLMILFSLSFLMLAACGGGILREGSQEQQEPGSVDFQNSCSKLTINSQDKFGGLCLKEIASDVNKKIAPHNLPFIELNKLKNLTSVKPDFPGTMGSYYKATFGDKDVFVKLLYWMDNVIKNPRGKFPYEKNLFFNEIFWIQKLAENNLGPSLLGVTVMKETWKDIAFALVLSNIDGKTYPLFQGKILEDPSPKHKKAIEFALPKLEALLNKYHAIAVDLQFMVDKNNRAWVIDPARFKFTE